MPEGDTLRRAAAALTPVLEGRTLTDAWFRSVRGHAPRRGMRVEGVEAVGKHLLVHFDRGLTLDTHLGMSGWWRTSQSAPSGSPKLRVVLSTEAGHAMCYAAPIIRTYLRDADRTPIDDLGPDLSNDTPRLDTVMERSRARSQSRTLADLLLDQHVAAGVGNVYKSETLFLARMHPFHPVGSVSDADLILVWTTANRLLVANRDRDRRRTTPPQFRSRTFVYDRHRLGCLRCPDSISYDPAGSTTQRSTYWCPSCQRQG